MIRTNPQTITDTSKFEKIEAEVSLLSAANIKEPNRNHGKLHYWLVPNINAKMNSLSDMIVVTFLFVVLMTGLLVVSLDFVALSVFVPFLLVAALVAGIMFASVISNVRSYTSEKKKAQLFQRDLKWLASKTRLDEERTKLLLLGETATAEDLVQYVLHIENGIITLHSNRLADQPLLIELDNNFAENA
jgi:hypothetical protein